MPDDRLDRYYAASPSHPELAGVWLRAVGIELVGRDGRRETLGWDHCQAVAWATDHAEVVGPDMHLVLDGRFGLWPALARDIAADIASCQAGKPPRQRLRPPQPEPWVVTAEQMRQWLGLQPGETLRWRQAQPREVRAMVAVICLLVCFATPVFAVAFWAHMGIATLLYPLCYLPTVLGLLRSVDWAADEYALKHSEPGWVRRPTTACPWPNLMEVTERRLRFVESPLTLPPGECGDRVLHAAREVVAAKAQGGRLPTVGHVPETALSRMHGPVEQAPDAAISRAAGGPDA